MLPVNFTFTELLEHKASGVPQAALNTLRNEADKILNEEMLSVTKKRMKSPSGNPHDYISAGLYWWPNPDTPDGLPYVRRDGIVNPDSNDKHNMGKLGERIYTLALAYFYFGDKKYSDYASKQLYDWFINPDTFMNPAVKYVQAIPGICDGRGTGLIDFANNSALLDGIGILDAMGVLSEDVSSGIKAWLTRYTDTILTTELGIDEDNAYNNHGTWYDAQILLLARITDRPNLCEKICKTAYFRRIATQIKPDGSQPHELARTKGMNYSVYNINAATVLASCARKLGYSEYFDTDRVSGVCLIKAAVDYIYPYIITGCKDFPYQELDPGNPVSKTRIAVAMLRLAVSYPDESYAERAKELAPDASPIWLTPIN